MALLLKNDVLFAHKALNLVAGISGNARRVAGAIIDHFNKKTGQCDPSIERLARMLDIDRATVLRATTELCDPQGAALMEKISHGGKGNRASYVPNWDHFQKIVLDWDRRMKTGDAPDDLEGGPNGGLSHMSRVTNVTSNVAELRPYTSQDCDLERRKTATQTLLRNPSKKPLECIPRAKTDRKPSVFGPAETEEGLLRGRPRKPSRQGQQPRQPREGGASARVAAQSAAERRWYAAVRGLGSGLEAAVIEWMTQERQDAATAAELERRGGGVAYIVDAMKREAGAASVERVH